MKNFIFNSLDILIENIIELGPVGGMLLIILESIFPILPLALFVAINMYAFGTFWGIILSWIATVIGSILSFVVFRKGFGERLHYKTKDKEKVNDLINWISSVKLKHLTVLLALPFIPSFLVNIAAGLSKIKFKKFVVALFIGKIFMVYFWGYIGYNLIEVFNHPEVIFEVMLFILLAYLISKYIGEKLNID